MPETDTNKFEVEHSEDFTLTPDQFKKLIWYKMLRNGYNVRQFEERESQGQLD